MGGGEGPHASPLQRQVCSASTPLGSSGLRLRTGLPSFAEDLIEPLRGQRTLGLLEF